MANDLVDRKYVSRYSQPGFGIKVLVGGTMLTDADALPTVSFVLEGQTDPEWSRSATRESLGSYGVVLSSLETSQQAVGTLLWNYSLMGVQQAYGLDIEVGPSAPAYDALGPAWQGIIEQVWAKFADLYDSPYGGPNLQVYIQTKFGRNRLAQLLVDALQTLNTTSSPHASYPLGGIDFPFEAWGGLLSRSLYIEVVKHLIRSYTEIPEAVLGTAVSRLDRRDYMQRWTDVLNMETDGFAKDLDRYKMANLGLGYVAVLVSGGGYGNWGPEAAAGGAGALASWGYNWVNRVH